MAQHPSEPSATRPPLPEGWRWERSMRNARNRRGLDPVDYVHPQRADGAYVWQDWDEYNRHPEDPNRREWMAFAPGVDGFVPAFMGYRRRRKSGAEGRRTPRYWKTMAAAMAALDREIPMEPRA